MWFLPTVVYWSSAGVLAYTYAGYPLAMSALARLRPRPVRRDERMEPTVTVVMAARDEEARVGAKLDNLLALEYPADKLDVVVVSDGSSDGTDEVVRGYAEDRVRLVRVEGAGDKAQALNAGVAAARGELVLFCDVRQQVNSDALRAMAPLFGDPEVGAVSGELVMESSRGPGVYWAYEKLIRAAEARFDSTVGATGALYAIRRELFSPLPEGCLLDDMYTPLQIVMQGYRVLLESGATCADREAELAGEFSRKARTLAGNFQLLGMLPRLLSPLHNRLLLQFASHKLMRLACPAAMAGLLASNVVLVATGAPGWPLYAATLAGQVTVYGLALRAHLCDGEQGRLTRLSHTFVVLNLAAVEGLRRYLKGEFGWTTDRDS